MEWGGTSMTLRRFFDGLYRPMQKVGFGFLVDLLEFLFNVVVAVGGAVVIFGFALVLLDDLISLHIFAAVGCAMLAGGAWFLGPSMFFRPVAHHLAPGDPNALGSARLASKQEAKRASEGDFALGRTEGGALFYDSGHVLTCAPTGAGKGIGAVIPNLLHYPGSAFVVDVKGENYAVTRRAREAMGQQTALLDPFDVTGTQADSFNWLDLLDPESPDIVGDASMVAEMLIPHSDDAGSRHWDESARDLLRGLIAHVATFPRQRATMGEVRRLLTLPPDEFGQLLDDMAANSAAYDIIARAANAFRSKADREAASVLSNAQRQTALLDDPRVVETLGVSTFDLAALKRQPLTVYVVMPPDRLDNYARFIRGLLGLSLSAMTRDTTKPDNPALFMVDEFAQLGYMQQIESGVSLMRGYGVRFWLLVQDLSQLEAVYGKWRTFLANATLQAFGATDQKTAEHLSEVIGDTTVTTKGHSYSEDGVGASDSQASRRLVTADEIRAMPAGVLLTVKSGMRPLALRRLNYLQDREFQGQYDDNPMYG